MSTAELFFTIFVVFAFIASAVDHWFVGQGYVFKPLRAFLLGCFIYTEGYLAISSPVLWLYVILNFWGLANLFYGKRVPLRQRRRK